MSISVQWQRRWSSGKAWSTELRKTFSARPLFKLCEPQTPTENLWFSCCFPAMIQHYLKRRCWHNTHAQNVWELTGVTLTNINQHKCKKYIHIHKYKEQILSMDPIDFCFKKNNFLSIQVTQEGRFDVYLSTYAGKRQIQACILYINKWLHTFLEQLDVF